MDACWSDHGWAPGPRRCVSLRAGSPGSRSGSSGRGPPGALRPSRRSIPRTPRHRPPRKRPSRGRSRARKAIRWPPLLVVLCLDDRGLVTELKTSNLSIDLWNVRAVPGNGWGEEKIKIFKTVYKRLNREGQAARILAGDFNTPKAELADGQAIPFGHDKDSQFGRRKVKAELQIIKGLGHLGMRDVFREQHGYGDIDEVDWSWEDKRFDHIFASGELQVSNCAYDQAGLQPNDHAPLFADFEIEC